ncbi:unnamed protein product [Sphagnum troendelagicum]|uniref:Remorin C-terminal domain-containing protein n=1 Tax=Sphagnum jensenii TaxID=128206 RepID=A0ABP0WW94_9BRYO
MLQNTWVSSEPVDEEGQFLRFCIQNVCFCHPRSEMPLWNGDVGNETHLYPHSSELAADGSTAHGGHHANEHPHVLQESVTAAASTGETNPGLLPEASAIRKAIAASRESLSWNSTTFDPDTTNEFVQSPRPSHVSNIKRCKPKAQDHTNDSDLSSPPPCFRDRQSLTAPTWNINKATAAENKEHNTAHNFLLRPQTSRPVAAPPGSYNEEDVARYQHLANQQHNPESRGEADEQSLKANEQAIDNVMQRRSGDGISGIAAAGGEQMENLLARVKQEKKAFRARTWEESTKAKALQRYARDETKINEWENSMKAKAEAQFRKAEAKMEKQRSKHMEKMNHAFAEAHVKAQDRRAATAATKAKRIAKAEAIVSRIRATGRTPSNCPCCSA